MPDRICSAPHAPVNALSALSKRRWNSPVATGSGLLVGVLGRGDTFGGQSRGVAPVPGCAKVGSPVPMRPSERRRGSRPFGNQSPHPRYDRQQRLMRSLSEGLCFIPGREGPVRTRAPFRAVPPRG